MYGSSGKKMVLELLEKIEMRKDIPEDSLIGIKPNLVSPRPSDSGATTDPDMVAAVIEYLQSYGFRKIIILESAWHGASTMQAFKICGFEELSVIYGVPLIDLKKDKTRNFNVNGMDISVCKKALEVDYMINMPVLKAHSQTIMTCALKNIKGCIPDREKRRFHGIGLHKPVAYLNKIIKSDLIIVDGIIGDLSSEIGGRPIRTNRVLIGQDPVLIDTYVAGLMGIPMKDMLHVNIANEIGIGSVDIRNANILELNNGSDVPEIETNIISYPQFVIADQACSACYGGLMHALERIKDRGKINRMEKRIYVGQAYKEKTMNGIGIGNCTCQFNNYVQGCPPSANDILRVINNE